MKKLILLLFAAVLFTSCLTVNQKDILPAPYMPEIRETDAAESVLYLFSGEVDFGKTNGVYALKLSHGLTYNSEDAEAYFQAATDNERIYFLVTVSDDHPLPTDLDPSAAWDADSIEVFLGQDTRRHTTLGKTDHMLRVSFRSDGSGQLGLDNILVKDADVSYELRENGYTARFSISLKELGWNEMTDGQKIRAEYALNDADSASRDLKLQWTGDDDLAYADASKWGNVTVKEVK